MKTLLRLCRFGMFGLFVMIAGHSAAEAFSPPVTTPDEIPPFTDSTLKSDTELEKYIADKRQEVSRQEQVVRAAENESRKQMGVVLELLRKYKAERQVIDPAVRQQEIGHLFESQPSPIDTKKQQGLIDKYRPGIRKAIQDEKAAFEKVKAQNTTLHKLMEDLKYAEMEQQRRQARDIVLKDSGE